MATHATHDWGAPAESMYDLGAAPGTPVATAAGGSLVAMPIEGARRLMPREGEQVLPLGAPAVAVPQINGLTPGRVAWATFWVPLAALRPAADGYVRHSYDPEKDPHRAKLIDSIRVARGLIAPLICRPTTETVRIGDQEYPVLEVVYGRRCYFALREMEWPEAPVRIWDEAVDDADQLLFGLTDDGQQVKLPLMDRCDAVRRLREARLSEGQIARHMGCSQSYVARMDATSRAADECAAIRLHVTNGVLGVDHVAHLIKLRDPAARELATHYAVQEGYSIEATGALVSALQPPPERGTPRLRLVEHFNEEGERYVEATDLTGQQEGVIRLTPERRYWQRGKPLVAAPISITTRAESLRIKLIPTASGVLVDTRTLGVRDILRRVGTGSEVALADLEVAYLSDLEAIRQQIEAMRAEARVSDASAEEEVS